MPIIVEIVGSPTGYRARPMSKEAKQFARLLHCENFDGDQLAIVAKLGMAVEVARPRQIDLTRRAVHH